MRVLPEDEYTTCVDALLCLLSRTRDTAGTWHSPMNPRDDAEKALRIAISVLLGGEPFLKSGESLLGTNRDGTRWYIDHWAGVGIQPTQEKESN